MKILYLALLRGINVGGKNNVEMKKLKLVFEKMGFEKVQTYINSGNVLFLGKKESAEKLGLKLEKAVESNFGVKSKVLIRDLAEIQQNIASLPNHWTNDTTMKCDIMFLTAKVDSSSITNSLTIKPKIDQVKYSPGAIIWSVDRKLVTRSGLLKIIGTPLYQEMTIRNCNTLRKLAKLMENFN